jgi:hypothetical protein
MVLFALREVVLAFFLASGSAGAVEQTDWEARSGKPIKLPPKVVEAPLASCATGRQLP